MILALLSVQIAWSVVNIYLFSKWYKLHPKTAGTLWIDKEHHQCRLVWEDSLTKFENEDVVILNVCRTDDIPRDVE